MKATPTIKLSHPMEMRSHECPWLIFHFQRVVFESQVSTARPILNTMFGNVSLGALSFSRSAISQRETNAK